MKPTLPPPRRLHIASAALALAACTAALPAHAHGDKEHAKAAPTALKKEQKDWGIAGDAKAVNRTIQVGMSDAMRFTPDAITVRPKTLTPDQYPLTPQQSLDMLYGVGLLIPQICVAAAAFTWWRRRSG